MTDEQRLKRDETIFNALLSQMKFHAEMAAGHTYPENPSGCHSSLPLALYAFIIELKHASWNTENFELCSYMQGLRLAVTTYDLIEKKTPIPK